MRFGKSEEARHKDARGRRRIRSPASASLGMGPGVKTHYYSRGRFCKYFKHFTVVDARGLSVFVPPPYMAGFMRDKKGLLDLLSALDAGLAHRPPFNALGDHLIEIRETLKKGLRGLGGFSGIY